MKRLPRPPAPFAEWFRQIFADAVSACRASVRLSSPGDVQGLFGYAVTWVALMVIAVMALIQSIVDREARWASAAFGLACAGGSVIAMIVLALAFRQDTKS